MRHSVWGLSPLELEALLVDLGEPSFRATQLLRWLYKERRLDLTEMTDLPTGLRQRLDEHLDLRLPEVLRWQSADDGQTKKALVRLADSETIETVLMQYAAKPGARRRATVCVSTQVGCAMGCSFCATGQAGFVRNLATAEIVAQVMSFARENNAITNVVFMGMGEPLANYPAMWKAVEILNHPHCFGLGARHITISTVGLIPGIRRLAREHIQVNLAVSLHAADDDLRRSLIPTAGQPVQELVRECKEYFAATGRRVTFEYVLIDRVNDSDEQARRLASLLSDFPCHVNLIPVNPTADSSMRRPSRSRTLAFEAILRGKGIACTVRVEKGTEIDSACGQLRGIRAGAGRRGVRQGELPVPLVAS
jgi:23S rRNA (adenine2503-C2)-methyltransferase